MRILVSCPPMLGMIDSFEPLFEAHGWEVVPARIVQTLSEDELIRLLPAFDGWIIGDDPATARVLEAGCRDRLKAAVKWGVGIDNVDFEAARALALPVANTPRVFGNEVADVAMHYVTALARETYLIDRGVREGGWPKPRGISLAGRTVALVGLGDVGRQLARRLDAAGLRIIAYDPAFAPFEGVALEPATWPLRLEEADFLVFTCPLTPATHGLFNADLLGRLKPGVRVVNVGRGPVIREEALIDGLRGGVVHSAALDVFEIEPLPAESPLRAFERCIFGSHNASNTADAVKRVSETAIGLLAGFLEQAAAR